MEGCVENNENRGRRNNGLAELELQVEGKGVKHSSLVVELNCGTVTGQREERTKRWSRQGMILNLDG